MAKLGKFSTGIATAQPPMSSYAGQGNNGYAQRSNEMGDGGMDKHTKVALGPRHTATGNKVLVKPKDIKRKM